MSLGLPVQCCAAQCRASAVAVMGDGGAVGGDSPSAPARRRMLQCASQCAGPPNRPALRQKSSAHWASREDQCQNYSARPFLSWGIAAGPPFCLVLAEPRQRRAALQRIYRASGTCSGAFAHHPTSGRSAINQSQKKKVLKHHSANQRLKVDPTVW